MIKTIFVLLILQVTLVTSTAFAENWKFVTRDKEGGEYFIDADSITKKSYGTRYITKYYSKDARKLQEMFSLKDEPTYDINDSVIDCKSNTMHVFGWQWYGKNGHLLHTYKNFDDKYHPFQPGDHMSKFAKIICN